MYCSHSHSPVLSVFDHSIGTNNTSSSLKYANSLTAASSPASLPAAAASSAAAAAAAAASISAHSTGRRCLRFKYFTTFLICTISLALLSASLATHKWIVSRPIRVLRLNGTQTSYSALMLTVANDQTMDRSSLLPSSSSRRRAKQSSENGPPTAANSNQVFSFDSSSFANNNNNDNSNSIREFIFGGANRNNNGQVTHTSHNKFQGEIYFGLFNGVKVLNYGFGDRVSQISVVQPFVSTDKLSAHDSSSSNSDATTTTNNGVTQQRLTAELVSFKLWLVTLSSTSIAIVFALIGSVFATINFVMTPRGTLSGPIGLVIWNTAQCFSCLTAMVAWLIEFFTRLQNNVLTNEEFQNGWTSEGRSQFGYSYYFVVLAFILSLVNIFIVSLVRFESWTSDQSLSSKRHSRATCEGVIMLY